MSHKELIALLYAKYNTLQLTKAQTAKEVNVSQSTLDNMRRDGSITGKKVSSQIMFSLSEVARVTGDI